MLYLKQEEQVFTDCMLLLSISYEMWMFLKGTVAKKR